MPYSNRNSVQSKEDWKADGGGGVETVAKQNESGFGCHFRD